MLHLFSNSLILHIYTMILKEGQVIRDTYEVDRFLGEGAFAEVYRVIRRFLGRQVTPSPLAAGWVLTDLIDDDFNGEIDL